LGKSNPAIKIFVGKAEKNRYSQYDRDYQKANRSGMKKQRCSSMPLLSKIENPEK
jgi:hypothetical protein